MKEAQLPEGATPLDPDEAEGLIPTHIATRGALNEWEQANILRGVAWASTRKRPDVLSTDFALELHRRMFDATWTWAGTIRRTERSIGVPPGEIRPRLHDLFADATHWLEHRTYDVDECAVRVHHRLTWIHPFPNGNGRHARLMADVFVTSRGQRRFSWGQVDLGRRGDARRAYLRALREADKSNVEPLLAFVRT